MHSQVMERIKSVLAAEAEAILSVKPNQAFEQAVDILYNCQGKVIATGIGKAGLIAHKFASTLSSTATSAVYIHAAEASHGDLGTISQGDVLVAFSTSGKSLEVLEMVSLSSHHLGLDKVIGVTSHADSKLRALSDIVVDMGEIKEPCPLGLTPSASIAVMLAVSDAIALALMERKGVTKDDYGIRHHGGYLGRAARTDNQAT